MERKSIVIDIPDGMWIDESNSTFERIVFKKKCTYPKSWEEFCKNTPINEEYYLNQASSIRTITLDHRDYEGDKNVCKTKEEAEAFLALIQLKRLWHEYVDNYPEKVDDYYFIDFFTSIYGCQCRVSPSRSVISKFLFKFPSRELAQEFLHNFKDLIIKASPLWN